VGEVDTVRTMVAKPTGPKLRATDSYVAVVAEVLSVEATIDWATLPQCGAVVTFTGVVREYSTERAGRPAGGVVSIDYQAYESVARVRLIEIADAARERWPGIGRIALLHRVGSVRLGEASVLVCVSSGHRVDAFLAAQFCIDVLKACVPVWKLEQRAGISDWVETGVQIEGVERAASHWLPATYGRSS